MSSLLYPAVKTPVVVIEFARSTRENWMLLLEFVDF